MLRRVEKMLYDFPFPPDIEAADGKKIKWNHPDFSIISSHQRTDGSMETFAIKQILKTGTSRERVLKEIKALASGQLIFHIKVKGKCPDTTEPGHAAFAHLAVNPLDKAIVLQQALTKLGQSRW